MAKLPKIPLPQSWPPHVRSAMLHIISLAPYATAYTRGWAANSANARIRSKQFAIRRMKLRRSKVDHVSRRVDR